MKRKYINPQAYELEMIPEYVLAQSSSFNGSGDDVNFDGDSDFDSFFGA